MVQLKARFPISFEKPNRCPGWELRAVEQAPSLGDFLFLIFLKISLGHDHVLIQMKCLLRTITTDQEQNT